MESLKNVRKFLAIERNVKVLSQIQSIFNSLSITEKSIFLLFGLIFAGTSLTLLYKVNTNYMVEVPTFGGQLTEGIVGTPRFINPLLAISDADRDLTTLVYSGLLKSKPDGSFVPDLARTYSISPDGLTYTFIIRDNAVFHDGKTVTVDDVIYTVTKAQDSSLKSPRRINWEGVSVTKTNDLEVVFSLKQPYAPFISNLTLGILPSHIWKQTEGDQFTFSMSNLRAIGSGPYKIESVGESNGIPEKIVLSANPKYALGKPFIENIIFKFYQNESDLLDALKNNSVDSAGNIGSENALNIPTNKVIMRAPLTRIFGIFFNQNEKEILAHKEVRKALSLAIDRDEIISKVLHGYGTQANGPLPHSDSVPNTDNSIEAAQTLLEKAGWKKNSETGIYELKTKTSTSVLSLSLSTGNVPELVESAKIIEEAWKKIGVALDVRVFEPSDLNQSVIRPRKYDSLLFGIVTGRNPDLYPFWHSSQRNDPGLNIALYTNIKVDRALETMRNSYDSNEAKQALTILEKEIAVDSPAIFLWSPDFIYAVPKKLYGISLGEITTPSDRFIGVHDWYIETDQIWRVFVRER